ncbi:MAG: bifunctional DNA primase/polymerase [Xanthobacteraceae bacterium]
MDDAEFEELPKIEPSWLRLQHATTLRKRLLAAGYTPLPCNGKAPPIPGWQDIVATSKLIDTWERRYPDATNTGVLTDISPAIDIDIMHPDAAAAIEALAREHFEEHGYVLVRFGKAPKRAILLRTNEPFNKIARMLIAPDGSTQKIEILATGQQIVVAGIHPETKRNYSWHGGTPGEIKREELPYVHEAGMHAFVDAAVALLIGEFGFTAKDNSKRRKANDGEQPHSEQAGIREGAYAQAALDGCAEELAAAASGSRNELLNKLAFRLGRMITRGWLDRADVEAELIGAMHANGAVADDGLAAAAATLRSGIDAGMAEPHTDLADQDDEKPSSAADEQAQHPRQTLDEVREVFRKWLGRDYDVDVIDAVLATGAAERLAGDPLWLLVISGPGNAKTETVQALSGTGAYVTSTITSEGALLSASPRRERRKNATGGLLRKIGDRGVLVIKDVTSILSADRNTRGVVLAALREIYDGRWERNVGSDGGQTLTWTGRIAIVGAVTTAWDASHAVMAVMGDRFVLIRSDSTTGRIAAGNKAIRNTGTEKAMRAELAAAVGGIIGHVDCDGTYELRDDEIDRLIRAADVVTYARTAVERDYRGDVIDAHAPEMPTRFAKQLAQMVRGSLALGMSREAAMRLALRCARDSAPPLRIEILLDLASHPRSRAIDVSHNVTRPLRTVRRELEALHMLKLLRCDEEKSAVDENKTIWRYSLAEAFDRATLLSMVHPAPF